MKCGNCEYFFNHKEGGTLCMPIVERYGAEPVDKTQNPSVNCHLTEEEIRELKLNGIWFKEDLFYV